MKECNVPIDSWQASRDAALKKIKDRAKGDPILTEIAKEEDPAARAERSKNIEIIHKITDKCIQNYRDGEYSFEQTVSMISKALKKMASR